MTAKSTSLITVSVALAVALTLGSEEAQAAAECTDAPATGNWIECTEDSTSTDDITINADGVDIDTTGANEFAIYGKHEGNGKIDIDVGGASMIDTSGSMSHGIYGRHQGTGNILIKAENGVDIETQGNQASGVYAQHVLGAGDITIRVKGVDGADTITTGGSEARGVSARNYSKGNTEVTVTDVNITTTTTTEEGGNDSAYGVEGQSSFGFSNSDPDGPNNVNINVIGSQISTMESRATGIIGAHIGTNSLANEGDLEITATNTEITTAGEFGTGILGKNIFSNGNVIINMTGGSITTAGRSAPGITGTASAGATIPESGDISIKVKEAQIETTGASTDNFLAVNYGVHAGNYKDGKGDIAITLEDSTITTHAHAVYGERNFDTGDIKVNAIGGSLTTKGVLAHGIYAYHHADGDIIIDTRNIAIETQSTDLYRFNPLTLSSGIYGRHEGTGDIDIDVQDGTIMTRGVFSYGIYARHEGDGNLMVDTSNGNVITTTGDNGHGIVAYHLGKMDSRSMAVTVGGSVNASGAGAQGVRVGALNTDTTDTVPDGTPERVPGVDAEGYRQQTVTVNGAVTSAAEGVFLAGGGRVVIGPRGSIASKSGIAILAKGDTPGANPGDSVIKPKLRVDLNLGGRKVAEAIGNNWIINDGGETTIAVNNVVLHEGEKATGVTGRTAANGAWNVRMLEHGVKLDDYTNSDPSMWTRTQSTVDDPIIADRDFSANDFTETRRPRPPPPSMCPAGQVGTPPDCSAPVEPQMPVEPEMPMFMEEYAPRAALYEVLPDFMLRMQNWEPTRPRFSLPESPVYIRLLGSTGSQEFKHSTVNANYDAGRFAVEVGVNIPVSEDFNIGASAHHVTGSAEVYSPVNGGDIDVTGAGLSVDAYWSSGNDYYATGRLSLTDYDMDLSSNTIGRLKSNGDAYGQSLHVETGRRMTLSENLHWTPRAWLGHTRISVDNFTDAVDSRVSFPTTDRLTGGFGVMAETVRTEYGGELLLRGSLDFEQKLGGSKTVALVSGERLSAEPEKGSAILSLSGTWHKGPFTYSAVLSARQDLHSGGEDYSGVIHVGMNF